jgi:hypothetical protein
LHFGLLRGDASSKKFDSEGTQTTLHAWQSLRLPYKVSSQDYINYINLYKPRLPVTPHGFRPRRRQWKQFTSTKRRQPADLTDSDVLVAGNVDKPEVTILLVPTSGWPVIHQVREREHSMHRPTSFSDLPRKHMGAILLCPRRARHQALISHALGD